jgi:hypothetical protein
LQSSRGIPCLRSHFAQNRRILFDKIRIYP